MTAALTPELQQAVARECEQRTLPIPLVTAIVLTESSGDCSAWKVEPQYRYLVNVATGQPFRSLTPAENASEVAPRDFPHFLDLSSRDTEWRGQQASWGPMQIMGAVAREYGYKGHFPGLCQPFNGVQYGCYHLAKLRDRFFGAHGWEGVVAAYNAGSPRKDDDGKWVNQSYVDTVRRHGGFDWQGASQ